MDDCKSAQKREMELLRNKWLDNFEVFDRDTDYISGRLSVKPILTPDFQIRCPDRYGEVGFIYAKIESLPPIEIYFQLTPGYPAKDMPTYQLACLWLSFDQKRELCRELNRLWQSFAGSAILDTWASFLQEEAMAVLGIDMLLNLLPEADCDSPAKKKMKFWSRNKGFGKHRVLETRLCLPLSEHLIMYNRGRKYKKFRAQRHTCCKCSSVNLGSRTLVFNSCHHLFCVECMSRMVSTVKAVIHIFYVCPVPGCEQTISKSKVITFLEDVTLNKAYLVDEVTVAKERQKYDKPRAVDGDGEDEEDENTPKILVPCPKCEAIVGVFCTQDSLAICPCCAYVYCHMCNKTYHGLLPCHIAPEDKVKIFLAYTSANETEKMEYINKYGRKRLDRLVQQLGGERNRPVEEVLDVIQADKI